MKLMSLIVAAFLAVSLNCLAEPAKKETVEEMFKVMQTEKMMDSVWAQMDGMFRHMTQNMNIPEAQKPIMDKFSVRYTAMVREEMSWDKLKGPMADAYANVYTDKEIKDITKFYQSPAGQKMLKKMPELMQASMVMMQDMMKSMMPKMQALQKDLADELAAQQKLSEPQKASEPKKDSAPPKEIKQPKATEPQKATK